MKERERDVKETKKNEKRRREIKRWRVEKVET